MDSKMIVDKLVNGDPVGYILGAIGIIIVLNFFTAIIKYRKGDIQIEADYVSLGKFFYYAAFCIVVYICVKNNTGIKDEAYAFFNFFAVLFSAIEATDNICKVIVHPFVGFVFLKIK